jgi:hypothetical protein
LSLIASLYLKLDKPDYINVARIFVFLDDANAIADLFSSLLKSPRVRF